MKVSFSDEAACSAASDRLNLLDEPPMGFSITLADCVRRKIGVAARVERISAIASRKATSTGGWRWCNGHRESWKSQLKLAVKQQEEANGNNNKNKKKQYRRQYNLHWSSELLLDSVLFVLFSFASWLHLNSCIGLSRSFPPYAILHTGIGPVGM